MTLGIALPPATHLEDYRRASTMREADLWRGYSPPIVSRVCLCGGRIEAFDTERDIASAVLVHVRSTAHSTWAIAAGWR